MSAVSIAGREIGWHLPPYCVAEISGNHGGSRLRAAMMIEAAKVAGADAVKLQTYTPEELTIPEHKKLWDLYTAAQTPRSWHPYLFEVARKNDITIFSSAFSVDGVKFLQDLGAPAIKIASAEIRDEELFEAARATKLPIIVSTGMGRRVGYVSVDAVHGHNVVFLHCVSHYPARIEDANLNCIRTLQENVGELVGLSDHTPGYETAIAATALGAVMIEKHFKLDDDCIDADYSLNRGDFALMCRAVRAIHAGMGDGVIRPTCKPRER